MNEILVNEPGLPGKEEEYKRQCGIGMHISVWGRYRNIQSVLLPNCSRAVVCVAEWTVADGIRKTSFLSCRVLTEECLCRSNHLWCITSFLTHYWIPSQLVLFFEGIDFFFFGIIALYHYIRASGGRSIYSERITRAVISVH